MAALLSHHFPAGKVAASIAVEEVLLLLKICFLVLLYLFIWRVVRTASRDLRAPQESMILAPQRLQEQQRSRKQRGGRSATRKPAGRLVVLSSPALSPGDLRVLDSEALTIGRSRDNDLPLERDEFSSSRHARVEPRPDGVWIEDVGSTNGTLVNGEPLNGPRRLSPGDTIRIGETDLRFER